MAQPLTPRNHLPPGRARWARNLARLQTAAELDALKERDGRGALLGSVPWTPDSLPLDPRFAKKDDEYVPKTHGELPAHARVGIVGAGAAGLYLAMLLDSIGIPYDLLEASERVGGRMYTHHFSTDDHDYYDIGAMRYPNIEAMQRTFDLFQRLKIPLIQYFLSEGTCNVPSRFNDVNVIDNSTPPRPPPPTTKDVYRVGVSSGGSVPDKTVDTPLEDLLTQAFGEFKDALQKDWPTGFKKLMQYDKYSTRQYLREEKGGNYDFYSIQWLETQNTSSGLFDQAFSESVIDSFDFDPPQNPNPPIPGGHPWYCILGGTSLLADAMAGTIKGTVETGKRASRIWINHEKAGDANMYVQCVGEAQPREYVTVFNTTTLACLQRMDLTGLDLHPTAKDAIRCLHYDNSCKVAIKFARPWWIEDCGITSGGVGSTDLPLRTCVYPSYNLHDKNSTVLLCSYTWAQDAVRVGSLISRDSPAGEEELRELILDDLAKLHVGNFVGKTLQEARQVIADAYQTHHAWAWTHDPHTSGAFALFGPGQFENFYPFLIRPAADAKFHMVGEASSAHHAWIVGALGSALAACSRFLNRFQLWDKLAALHDEWGSVPELDDHPTGSAHCQILLGQQRKKDHVQIPPIAQLTRKYL